MGSQALPAAPPSVANLSCVSVTRTNAHPFSLDTSRRNNRNLSTTTTDNDESVYVDSDPSVDLSKKRYSWNPYHEVQIEEIVTSPEFLPQNRDKGFYLPSPSSSTQESPALTSHAFGYDDTPHSQARMLAQYHSPVPSSLFLPPSEMSQYKDDDYVVRFSHNSFFDASRWNATHSMTPPSLKKRFSNGVANIENSYDMSTRTSFVLEEQHQHQPMYPGQQLPFSGQRNRGLLSCQNVLCHLQPGISCGMNGDTHALTPPLSTSHNLSKCVLRFKKMLPPPFVYKDALVVLGVDKGKRPEDVVKSVMTRWYSRIELLKEELLLRSESLGDEGTHGNNSSNNRNRRARPEIYEWCPEPPQMSEQGDKAFREWAMNCYDWWRRMFVDKIRMTGRSRGGREKGSRYHHNHYRYNNATFNDNSGSGHNGNNANTTSNNNNNSNDGGI
ncbi:hypothetical protein LSM04_007538 [Trypanosoma melophagium]|uniref:uncharacterized protein n=1 Tax=Trypanosoma melophagium TaxID=715481 RepID=UPI00351A58A6|nr:hypothetical protein LSM04_007538 [Trypanosoma melophagium]